MADFAEEGNRYEGMSTRHRHLGIDSNIFQR